MRTLLCILALLSSARGQETRTSVAGDIDVAQSILLDVTLNFHHGVSIPDTCAQQLSDILHRISAAADSILPHSIRGHPTRQHNQQNLKFALFQFDLLRSQPTNHDTLRDAFRELFYAFHRFSQPYLYQRAGTPAHILVFSASVTCECTRRMCDEYIAELALLQRTNQSDFDLVIVDSVVNPELMAEYTVTTIPTAIAIDREGNVTGRLEGNDHLVVGMERFVGTILGGTQ
jgi:hypothetical protein